MSERGRFAGAEWLKKMLPLVKKPAPSLFGEAVADILGGAFLGLYHLEENVLFKADWTHADRITVTISRELATYDGFELSGLVVLCHDAHVRLAIHGCGPGYLRLLFHRREREGDGAVWHRHPTLEGHAASIREKVADLRPEGERA